MHIGCVNLYMWCLYIDTNFIFSSVLQILLMNLNEWKIRNEIFEEKFSSEKKRKKILTFNDILTVTIFCCFQKPFFFSIYSWDNQSINHRIEFQFFCLFIRVFFLNFWLNLLFCVSSSIFHSFCYFFFFFLVSIFFCCLAQNWLLSIDIGIPVSVLLLLLIWIYQTHD